MPQQAAPATNSSAPSTRSRSTPPLGWITATSPDEREQEARRPAPADPLAEDRPGDQHREHRREAGDDDRAVRGGRQLEAVQEERVVAGDRSRSEREHERKVAARRAHQPTRRAAQNGEQERREREPCRRDGERGDVSTASLPAGQVPPKQTAMANSSRYAVRRSLMSQQRQRLCRACSVSCASLRAVCECRAHGPSQRVRRAAEPGFARRVRRRPGKRVSSWRLRGPAAAWPGPAAGTASASAGACAARPPSAWPALPRRTHPGRPLPRRRR